ncbi:MAG: hypothetical protein P4L59_02440 [Desulfosporosinus sp.]|nr:hypothetical protein [Desulfosporosinus sp.]
MKRLMPILLTIFILLGTQVALGATVVGGATSTQFSSTGIVKPNVYQTISGGQCSIVNNGNGTINIYGSTSTFYSVSQIGLQLNLQYLSGGQWYTLNTYSYYKNNLAYVSGGQPLGVSNGFYYRIFAQHTSLYGSISESGQSFSEAIYIQ